MSPRINYLHLILILVVVCVISMTSIGYHSHSHATDNTSLAPSISPSDTTLLASKHRGAHVFGYLKDGYFDSLRAANIDWVTIVPFGFQTKHDSPDLRHFNGDSTMLARSDSSLVAELKHIRSHGFKVFLKPHIWIDAAEDGKWRSDIYPQNEADWMLYQERYRDFITRFAKTAQLAEVDMFCIGTELSLLSVRRPQYWRDLIDHIRSVYDGKLTYAANWYEEYEKVAFWDQLDYIGVQAYFPLASGPSPSLSQIAAGWDQYTPALRKVSQRYQKKILFTEIGYKSTADSAEKPWEWVDYDEQSDQEYSEETQANCYRAFFDKVWGQDWMGGIHLWQWRSDYKGIGELKYDFTPQGKVAEQVIAEGFRK